MAVQDILENVLGDGARSTKFDLVFSFAASTQKPDAQNIPMLVKATEFPSKGHTRIDFRFRGRNVPIRGQVQYTNQWQCTFYLTPDHALKRSFEKWIESLDEVTHYTDDLDAGVPEIIYDFSNTRQYTTDVQIYQASFSENARTAVYELHNVFPVEVSQVQVSYEGTGEILTFDVTFAYSYFSENSASDSYTGDFSGARFGSFSGNFSPVNASLRTATVNSAGSYSGSSSTFSGLTNPINQAMGSAGGAVQAVQAKLAQIPNTFAGTLNAKASSLNAAFMNSSLLNSAGNVSNTLKNTASSLTQSINSLNKTPNFTNATQLLAGTINSEVSALIQPINAISSTINSYINTAKNIKNTLTSTISNTKNQAKNAVQSFKSALK